MDSRLDNTPRSHPLHPLSGKTLRLFHWFPFATADGEATVSIRQGDPNNQTLLLIDHNYWIVTIKTFQDLRDIWKRLTHSRMLSPGCLWKELAQINKWVGLPACRIPDPLHPALGIENSLKCCESSRGEVVLKWYQWTKTGFCRLSVIPGRKTAFTGAIWNVFSTC